MKYIAVLPYEGVMPELGEDVFVAPGAFVIGKVKLGKGASVWHNAVIRADNEPIEIGEYSNVQDNTVIHMNRNEKVKIGKYVLIGHSCVIHGCTINDYALIGMNATIMDGAVIGEGCIIGGGAVVSPNTVIPPYSVVMGVPGKVVKTIDEQICREARTNQALHYCNLAQKHRQAIEEL